MSICKHVEWDGKQFRGYVDLGTDINNNSLPEAMDALVFMVVVVNGSWKVPCGYFLVNGLTGQEKANLMKECITKLHEVGVKVVSFTCNGPTSHQSMLKLLGAQLLPDNLQEYFQHLCDPKAKYGVMLGTKLGFKCWRVEFSCCGMVLLVVSNCRVAFHLLAWRFA